MKKFILIFFAVILTLHLFRCCDVLCIADAGHHGSGAVCGLSHQQSGGEKTCHQGEAPSLGCNCHEDDGFAKIHVSLTAGATDVRPCTRIISEVTEDIRFYSIEPSPFEGPPRLA